MRSPSLSLKVSQTPSETFELWCQCGSSLRLKDRLVAWAALRTTPPKDELSQRDRDTGDWQIGTTAKPVTNINSRLCKCELELILGGPPLALPSGERMAGAGV